MSNLTDFFPSGGGGLTPKFQEFNASGTFTPTQALIDAGGYIEVFLVAGGGRSADYNRGGAGGEAFFKKLYLTSTSAISVNIGAGAPTYDSNGGNSSFNASSAGAEDLTALGGLGTSQYGYQTNYTLNASWGTSSAAKDVTAGNGIFGYGAGGVNNGVGGGIVNAKPNSGQGVNYGGAPGSGYCLIKWYE
jgi:hypothetical protein